ncbi:hypothetical protein M8J76_006075 [Diaphorina citri]|nr:hypothetical protein M8J75_011465 [Diaphorina citri]KAI5708910.1 hypothetical protein M8J76_006075 [Diaphorina citri]
MLSLEGERLLSLYGGCATSNGSFEFVSAVDEAVLQSLSKDSAVRPTLSIDTVPIISMLQLSRNETSWDDVCRSRSIKADFCVVNQAEKRIKSFSGMPLHTQFLEPIPVNLEAPYHKHLFSRAEKETLSYGSMSLLTWFKWMSYIGNPNLSEFRAIAGICKKYSDPLWTRKSDNSQLVKVDFTYNISNIFECLLNIFDLRLSLGGESSLSIDGREFDLNLILDDIVTYGSCSPKSFVKEIRGFLTYVARTAGSLSSETWTYRHECFDPCADRLGVHLSKEQVPGTLSSVFSKCQTYTKVRNNGFSVLASWNQTNLSELC